MQPSIDRSVDVSRGKKGRQIADKAEEGECAGSRIVQVLAKSYPILAQVFVKSMRPLGVAFQKRTGPVPKMERLELVCSKSGTGNVGCVY